MATGMRVSGRAHLSGEAQCQRNALDVRALGAVGRVRFFGVELTLSAPNGRSPTTGLWQSIQATQLSSRPEAALCATGCDGALGHWHAAMNAAELHPIQSPIKADCKGHPDSAVTSRGVV